MSHAARPSLLARFPFAGLVIPPLVGVTVWLSNMERVPYEDALPVVAAMAVLAALFLAATRLLVRDWVRAGLFAGIAGAYIFYLGPAVAALASPGWLRGGLLLVAAAAAVALARLVPREPAALLETNRKLSLILLPIALVSAGVALAKQAAFERQRPDPASVFPAFTGRAAADSPDVWHIILDRYAGSETLSRVYGYDNGPFLDALRARGFAVREPAFSNYQRTGHSVASTMNGAYLDPLAARMAGNERDWVPIYRAMTDNAALRFFAGEGYETVFAGSWWNPTRRSPIADRNVNFRAIPELGRLVLEQSVAGTAMSALGLPYGDSRADQCFRAKAKFGALRALAAEDGRKYVFGHFLVPHPPFVLNADGSCRSLAQAERASRADNYLSQLIYVNGELVALVDAILAGPRPALILIHSDEGPWPEAFAGDERFVGADTKSIDWTAAGESELREKLGILMAVRSPAGGDADLPVSPVNLYPRLLRNHFAGSRPDWPDRYKLFEQRKALYTFRDVTPLLLRASAGEAGEAILLAESARTPK